MEFVKNSFRIIQDIDVDITGCTSLANVLDRIKAHVKCPKTDILRITLMGDVPYDLEVSPIDIISTLSEYYFVDVKIKTKREINIADFEKDVSLKGEFVRKVYAQTNLSDDEKKEIISLGLRVMEGREVDL